MTRDLAAFSAELGFVACGIATLEPSRRGDALDAWLHAGYGGTMRYLHRQAAKRKRPGDIVPGATVAVVLLENYLPAAPGKGKGKGEGEGGEGKGVVKIAKYALGEDYHRALKRRLGLTTEA